LKRITKGLAQAAGLPENRMPIVTLENESSSATYNDPALAARVANVFRSWFGEENTIREKPVMGAEDFGLYGRTEHKVPICMFWLGTVDPKRVQESKRTGQSLPSLHSSTFHPIPEPTIKTGVTAMTAAALELLGKK